MSTAPGWADALGKQLAGDSDVWQRIRARKGSPFRHSAAEHAKSSARGTKNGGMNARIKDKRLEQALGPVESEE